MLKNSQNIKIGKTIKIQKRKKLPKLKKRIRSFGTLYESHGTRKTRSEQLRSRSIHWWPRMGRPGTEKCDKWSICFGFLDRCDIAILVTAQILMFWCFGRLWKLKFRLQKFILVQKFVKNIFFSNFDIIINYFQFFGFSHFVIFPIFMFL